MTVRDNNVRKFLFFINFLGLLFVSGRWQSVPVSRITLQIA